MSGRRTSTPVPTVMSREVRERLRSRAFAVTTLLLLVLTVAAGVVTRIASGDDDPTRYTYAWSGSAPTGFDDVVDVAGRELDLELVLADRSPVAGPEVEAVLRDGSVDTVLVVSGTTADRRGTIVTLEGADEQLTALLDLAWRTALATEAGLAAGLDTEQLEAVLRPPPLGERVLEPDDTEDPAAMLVGMLVAILLFMSISVFGGATLTGVVEEKSTGVVEVLLAHVRPHQLLSGKVLGIALVAFVQFAATLAAGVVSLRLSGLDIPDEVWVALPSSIVWFVGGFLLYTTVFALAGSLVSRQEDAQSAAGPVTMVMLLAYLAVFTVGQDPSSAVTRIMSVLPPFAPLLMPLRIATGSASVIEVVLAVVLLAAAIHGMLRLTGAVYGRTLLHRGARLRWSQVLRPSRNR